jgi:hypothetical protein
MPVYALILLLSFYGIPQNVECDDFYSKEFLALELKFNEVLKVNRDNFSIEIKSDSKISSIKFYQNRRGRDIINYIKVGDKLYKESGKMDLYVQRFYIEQESDIRVYLEYCDK